ncbi:MAG: DinB family protein, partial [Candidatus Acidiferrales bacterium]
MNTTSATRSSPAHRLIARLKAARERSQELFALVRPEAMYDRPIPERHRIIFYLGHIEAFDWNLLRGPLGLPPFDPSLDKLFSFGIDPVDGGLPADEPKDWPSIDQVRRYNGRLREILDRRLQDIAAGDPALASLENGRLLEVAIEHRLMHGETLAYMLHQLDYSGKYPMGQAAGPSAPRISPGKVEIPAGAATMGLPAGGNGVFGWDNEFQEQRVEVPAFAIDARNVTNEDFLR